MKIAVIGGSGFYEFPELKFENHIIHDTKYGKAEFDICSYAENTVVFLNRHGKKHQLLPNHINHKANITALKEIGTECIIATVVAGIVDPNLELGRPIVFDDLFFCDNRLPDGSICTFFDVPGAKDRGHLIMSGPFSNSMRNLVIRCAKKIVPGIYENGSYAYGSGPRFNTKTEIKMLFNLGISAIGQTAGPEAILSAEFEIPYSLIGFGIDYANGIKETPTPVDVLNSNLLKSKTVFKNIIIASINNMKNISFDNGFVYRFE